jgi:AcrR family transcriptional regulator
VERSTTANRAAVIDAACALFAERGYRGTSMKDIAVVLGVSAPGLYNHVASKQEILYAIMDRAMDRATAALDDAVAGVGDVAEQLRRATESLVLDFLRYPDEVTVCNNDVRSLEPGNRLAIVAKRDEYGARIRRIIASGRAPRIWPPSPCWRWATAPSPGSGPAAATRTPTWPVSTANSRCASSAAPAEGRRPGVS